ncbi:MAG: SPOR domain-containing protein [Pseudomonadota bacterium]
MLKDYVGYGSRIPKRQKSRKNKPLLLLSFVAVAACYLIFRHQTHQAVPIAPQTETAAVAATAAPAVKTISEPVQLAETPATKFEFYNLLSTDHTAAAAVPQKAAAVALPPPLFMLHLGGFEQRYDAEKIMEQLSEKGWRTTIATSNSPPWVIRIGPFASAEAASMAEKSMAQLSIPNKVIVEYHPNNSGSE